jgi:xylan 1,4-beta-xylosidase
VKASKYPQIPIIWSEYNASYANEPAVTDSPFMGPWLANNIRECDGYADVMSYWSFSDVFEEQGVVKRPFYGGFGLVAAGGIEKPAYNAFGLLHRLGYRRITCASPDALATRTPEGGLAIAVWNYSPPEKQGPTRTFQVRLKGSRAKWASVSIVDPKHGNAVPAWNAMGSPASPTQVQIARLRMAAKLPPPQRVPIRGGVITLTLPGWGLALIEAK